MKYKIFTVVNDIYLDFLYYFVQSALERCSDASEIIILYTGDNFKHNTIYNNDKIKIIKYHETIKTKNIWDVGWQKNVDLKTKYLFELAMVEEQPIFMIDVDCYFLKDFTDIVDFNADILVTKRNHNLPYIASFVGLIKPKRCIEFINVWRTQMNKISIIPKETTALVHTIPIMAPKINIQEIQDTVISCINFQSPPVDARILHFKGTRVGDAVELVARRLENLKNII